MLKSNIKRQKYLDRVSPFVDKDIIKVIVGQRRVGKSYLLYQIMDLIKSRKRDANIIYVNKEAHEFDRINDYRDLIEYVSSKSVKDAQNYLFLDEIQDISGFEKGLRALLIKKYDIYCTGSNAHMLSSDLATNLSGRYVQIPVYSLSYPEFLEFHGLSADERSLNKFIKYGGLPYLKNLSLDDETAYDYLRNIYSTIILNDVVKRFSIRHVELLERLVEYLCDNLGSLLSAKRISDFLKSQRISISPSVILNYLSYLESAFFIFKVKRTEIAGRKIFEVNDKYFFQDIGFRHALTGYRQVDIGKILENIVFSHLQYCGYGIHVGKFGNREVDFVCEKGGDKLYVQVAYLITSKDVREREFGNLLKIKDNYRKIVISMDKLAEGSVKGVEHINILDFLTKFN